MSADTFLVFVVSFSRLSIVADILFTCQLEAEATETESKHFHLGLESNSDVWEVQGLKPGLVKPRSPKLRSYID